MLKQSGVLLPISSLDGAYSIGSFGKPAERFIDFLADNGFTWWQILPLCNPDEFNSPYNSSSLFSINPYYIDIDQLFQKDLLTKQEIESEKTINTGYCNYKQLNFSRLLVLYKAFERLSNYDICQLENQIDKMKYVREYCIFMALRKENGNASWRNWTELIPDEKYLKFWFFLQAESYTQFKNIKKYANKRKIKILGDVPFYVSFESSDVYFHKKYFLLNKNNQPLYYSGARPDGITNKGQCWGHPVYNWKNLKNDGYSYWRDKINHAAELYDGIRFDHFRAFESFWAVPVDTRDPLKGNFMPGPGDDLFNPIKPILKDKLCVGEDLGYTTPEVQKLIDNLSFWNMRVFTFALKGNVMDFPINYTSKCIGYTGTHDTQTLKGCLDSMDMHKSSNDIGLYISLTSKDIYSEVIRSFYESKAPIIIFPIQDVLHLDDRFLLNYHKPSANNWSFRVTTDQLSNGNVSLFRELNKKYAEEK